MKLCHAQSIMIGLFSVWVSGGFVFMYMMHVDWVRNHGVERIYLFGAWGLFIVALSSWGYTILHCCRKDGG